MTKRFAFTLAEVLIALAIIGVVAAMTIPTFMANTAGAQFRTGFKKGITVLTQAAAANYATEGYDFGSTNVAYGTSASAEATNNAALNSIIGFNTTTGSTTKDIDMESDVQSLYHLFQGNLNMKNSNELANYEVGMPDVALNCGNADTITFTKPGESSTTTAAGKKSTELTSRATANPTTGAVASAVAIQSQGGIHDLCAGRTVAASTGLGGINQGRMFALEDGMVFTYDAGQASCTENNPCFGYLDVNGAQGPNKVISCSHGNDSYIKSYGTNLGVRTTGAGTTEDPTVNTSEANLLAANCTVDAKDITDIYPVVFYNSTVKPASLAAKAVLYSQKSNQ